MGSPRASSSRVCCSSLSHSRFLISLALSAVIFTILRIGNEANSSHQSQYLRQLSKRYEGSDASHPAALEACRQHRKEVGARPSTLRVTATV